MIKKGKIYHLLLPETWERALMENYYYPASLKEDGYIHCSTEAQLMESARLHFAEHEQLVVLEILVKRVLKTLVWEPGRAEEDFPHIYAMIPWEAIDNTRTLEKMSDGTFAWEVE